MPKEKHGSKTLTKTGVFLPQSELLSYEELHRVVGLASLLGMTKLRLTGGEPLIRHGVIDFINQLQTIDGLKQIRLTTNGVLLPEFAEKLFEVGVRIINVSLDTLSADKFKKITGKDEFENVWKGLRLAEKLGFRIKINVVAMKGINDNEIRDFARLALDHNFQVRFIEFMPMGGQEGSQKEKYIKAGEIMEIISSGGRLSPFVSANGEGPARMYEFIETDGEKRGVIGFISPISHHFCDTCNRLRLTSEGKLRACLLQDTETDLKRLLRGGASDQELLENIKLTIINKPQGHTLKNDLETIDKSGCGGKMSRIGG